LFLPTSTKYTVLWSGSIHHVGSSLDAVHQLELCDHMLDREITRKVCVTFQPKGLATRRATATQKIDH